MNPSELLLPSLFFLAIACDSESVPPPVAETQPAAPAPEPVKAPEPVQDALEGGPFPALLLGQAWFWKDAQNKPKPGPARLEIWRQTEQGWKSSRLEDGDSNVFHKAIPYDGGFVTIAAEKAMLKKWSFAEGAWKSEILWEQNWGGRFNRLRDLEIGDVDGDGKDEFVIASHDNGVVAVYNPDEPGTPTIELDAKPDTFVHEIEIGDIDGDGKNEFFATPSDRNKANASQQGGVVMYRFDGQSYVRSFVEQAEGTHAKEITVADVDGDGKDELFAVMEAELEQKKIVTPVQVRLYRPTAEGFEHKVIASIQDRQCRFLVPGDFDQDGEVELVAAAMKTGVWILDRQGGAVDGEWSATNIDTNSGGFEHVAYGADLDKDGKLELYVAADDQRELKRFTYNAETKSYDREVLGQIADDTISWNMEAAEL